MRHSFVALLLLNTKLAVFGISATLQTPPSVEVHGKNANFGRERGFAGRLRLLMRIGCFVTGPIRLELQLVEGS